jgi:hypothetical protein
MNQVLIILRYLIPQQLIPSMMLKTLVIITTLENSK